MGELPEIIDAEFEVVSGPLKQGDRHPEHHHWIFTGEYTQDGLPLFTQAPIWPVRHPFLTLFLVAAALAFIAKWVLPLLPPGWGLAAG